MSKRIVFCADGTWQAPLNNTNVYRLYKALTVSADQVTYYDDGVGADATGLNRVLQGAFGDGLLQKIQDGYTKIAHVYEPGDTIFLFGFSRGAYTVRSLAGMIADCGMPTGSFSDDCVAQAFAAYRDPANRASILAGLTACGLGQAKIQMVGVWDTVGSLGIPAIFGGVDESKYGFLNTDLLRPSRMLTNAWRWMKSGRSFRQRCGALLRLPGRRWSKSGSQDATAMWGAEPRWREEWMREPGSATSRWGGWHPRRWHRD